ALDAGDIRIISLYSTTNTRLAIQVDPRKCRAATRRLQSRSHIADYFPVRIWSGRESCLPAVMSPISMLAARPDICVDGVCLSLWRVLATPIAVPQNLISTAFDRLHG